MSFVFDKNLLPEFESIKDDDEEIIWTGKPVLAPYLISSLGVGLATVVSGITFVLVLKYGYFDGAVPLHPWFWLFALIPLIQVAFVFFNKLFSYSNTAYAYSNKRIMIRTGFIGTDFKTIDYDKISDIEAKVNIVERIFHVGTIRFFSGRTENDDGNLKKLYDRWEAIQEPYRVFKEVKQISVDIKTDYNYPNALRPDLNPGYKTKYKNRAKRR